ncbi:MAG: A/G-specific adenine glycosylase [Planctomycetes bacterium]|nr:A/G-specific adenine glycosylase [Planctomycetota bacterium]
MKRTIDQDASRETIAPDVRRSIRGKLLRWYDRNKRDLPWRRRAGNPYAQWVAEVMLQQTRVETVVAYYDRFMKRFPNIEALAGARHDTVLKHWEGMGYYRRIHHLHEAARLLHKTHRKIPATAAELRKLPGIGDYTAAAIASIAYGEPVAAVDGNVARVVARLRGITADILTPIGRRCVQTAATQLLSKGRAGDFNQAWMDLGSSICTPKSPNCDACPLVSHCSAVATGRVGFLPVRRRKKPPRSVEFVVGVFVRDGRLLLRRRPRGGLWSGLWEFPTIEVKSTGHSTARRHENMLRDLATRYDVEFVEAPTAAKVVRYQLTHMKLTFHAYVTPCIHNRHIGENGETVRWVSHRGLARLSISTAHRKVLSAALAARTGR